MSGDGFPRTLFVIDNLTVSGAEKAALNLLRHAQARGLPAEGFVYMDDLIGVEHSGARLQAFPGKMDERFSRRVLTAAGRVPALHRAARNFDLLVPVTPPVIPWAMAAAVDTRARVVPWIHYDFEGIALDRFSSGRLMRDSLMNLLHTRLAPSFDRLLFASRGALESFARAKGGAKRHWDWVPNVYDRTAWKDTESSTAAALEECRRRGKAALLFAGRISRQKQWEEAVRVAEILYERGFPFELHFAGDGPEMEQLRQLVRNSPASEAIVLHGFDLNLMAALRNADVLLLTSLHEAWPTIILEAFDLGIPVLSYDCPSGPAEMLGRELERGVLCQNAPEMADRIQWLLDPQQEPVRARMQQEGRAFLEQHLPEHSIERWARALRAMMEDES
jgi:glycosyltransferase involved in cell wall biosynthesis